MAFLDTLKSGWDKVKSLWNDLTSPTTTTATTPTTTTTTPTTDTATKVIWNAWTVVPNIQSAQTLNALAAWDTQETTTPDTTNFVSKGSEYYNYDANDEQKVKEALREREEWNESIWDWLTKKGKALSNFVSNLTNSANAENEYASKRLVTNIGYDRDSNDVYTLELWDNYVNNNWQTITNQQAFNNALETYDATFQMYWWYDNAPDEVKIQAFQKLYDDTKWLFVAKWDDYYRSDDWLKRKKNMFSEAQLEALANNNVKKWAYVPSMQQFQTYIQNLWKNAEIGNTINEKYKIKDTWFDIDNSQTSLAQWVFMNKAMQWVMELAQANLDSSQVWEAVANAYVIAKDNFERAWETAKPVFEDAAILREKAKQGKTLTEEERKTLEYANRLDDWLNAAASALNDFIKEHMDKAYISDNWSITEARDLFSWNRTLHEVISKPVIEALWLEDDPNMSWMDAFQEVTNDALYNYEISSWSEFGNWWEWFQNKMGKVWAWLSEFGQQTVYGLMQLGNYYTDATTLDFNSLSDRLNWRKAWTKMWEYLNQDFTIGTMINTEETWFLSNFGQDFSRTFRKYTAKVAEYGPEMAWNVIPDILLIWLTWWAWAPASLWSKFPTIMRAVSKGSKLLKLNNVADKLSWANSIRKAIGWMRWLEEASNAVAKATEVPDVFRFSAQRLGKLVKDWIIDQAIDWQYNQYDTEAYSDLSFGLSVWWTALFEILPWLYKSWAFKQIKNLVVWDYINKGTAWDAIDFLSKEENQSILENLTSKYWKNWTLRYDDFRRIASNMDELWDFLEKNWNAMPDYLKPSVNKWNKEMAWRIMNQVYDINTNSLLWRNIRAIISKEGTSLADLYKFIGNIPWDVKIGPWTSVIKLKNADGTLWSVLWVEWGKVSWYNTKLDTILDWWLTSKLENGFTLLDINKIKTLPEYSNLTDDLFTLDKDWKYYITKKWLDALWVSSVDMPIEFQAREIAKAEAWETSEQFRNIMKETRTSRKNLSDTTIDEIANTWTYQDVRDKVADVVC